jgi:hypothetical protein
MNRRLSEDPGRGADRQTAERGYCTLGLAELYARLTAKLRQIQGSRISR